MGKIRQRQQKRKSEIIEAALRLAEDTPFQDINVADICEAVDISVGGFYHYFNRKSDLLTGFFGLIDSYMEEEVFPLLTRENEFENLQLFAHGIACHVMENGVERAKLLNTISPIDVDDMKRPRPLKKQLTMICERGQEKGQFRKSFSPDRMADLLLIGARGVISDWARRDGPYSLVQTMDDYFKLVLSFDLSASALPDTDIQ